MPTPTGREFFRRHQRGKRNTPREAIWGKCYDCMGFYADGMVDCECPECPLYRWMPYRGVNGKKPVPSSYEPLPRTRFAVLRSGTLGYSTPFHSVDTRPGSPRNPLNVPCAYAMMPGCPHPGVGVARPCARPPFLGGVRGPGEPRCPGWEITFAPFGKQTFRARSSPLSPGFSEELPVFGAPARYSRTARVFSLRSTIATGRSSFDPGACVRRQALHGCLPRGLRRSPRSVRHDGVSLEGSG